MIEMKLKLISGSVNGGNSAELAKQEDIDGFLVGGASLKVFSLRFTIEFIMQYES